MALEKAYKWRHSLSSSVRDNVATESKQRLHKRIKKGEACDAKFRSDKINCHSTFFINEKKVD